MPTHTPLTLAEELVLVALDDEHGTLLPTPTFALEHALAASLIMELTLLGRLDSDATRLIVLSSVPTGNANLDEALALISADKEQRSTATWVARMASPDSQLRGRIVKSLVDRGILSSVEKRLLWVFKRRVYPPTSGVEEREVKARIMTLLYNDDIPDARDSLLVGLLRATGLFEHQLSTSEFHNLQPRIDQIANFDETNRSLVQTVAEMQILLTASRIGMA